MPIVDVHNHFYPPEYLDALRSGKSVVRVTVDSSGNPHIHYPGDYNVAVAGHRDIAYRHEVLEREGVDTQVITLTTPGTHVESPAYAASLALPGSGDRPARRAAWCHGTSPPGSSAVHSPRG